MGGYEVSLRGQEQQRKAPPSRVKEAAAHPMKRADPNSYLRKKKEESKYKKFCFWITVLDFHTKQKGAETGMELASCKAAVWDI